MAKSLDTSVGDMVMGMFFTNSCARYQDDHKHRLVKVMRGYRDHVAAMHTCNDTDTDTRTFRSIYSVV